MRNSKSLLSALLVLSLAAGILSQSAFAFGGKFAHNHPRRAEVLGRDHSMKNELKADRGQLGGNYHNLMAQDRRIQRQEQWDARMNGGHITRQEKHRLNREENRLDRRIGRDYHH